MAVHSGTSSLLAYRTTEVAAAASNNKQQLSADAHTADGLPPHTPPHTYSPPTLPPTHRGGQGSRGIPELNRVRGGRVPLGEGEGGRFTGLFCFTGLFSIWGFGEGQGEGGRARRRTEPFADDSLSGGWWVVCWG